jgi:hypothetical protein
MVDFFLIESLQMKAPVNLALIDDRALSQQCGAPGENRSLFELCKNYGHRAGAS